jgi:hypothetical protein
VLKFDYNISYTEATRDVVTIPLKLRNGAKRIDRPTSFINNYDFVTYNAAHLHIYKQHTKIPVHIYNIYIT